MNNYWTKNKKWKTIIHADVVNTNGRIYPLSIIRQIVEDFKKNKLMMGQIGTPKDSTIRLADVSHKINCLEIVDNKLMANIQILNSPQGKELTKLMESNDVKFRTQGVGSVEFDNEKQAYVIQPNYKLISIHAYLGGVSEWPNQCTNQLAQ